MTTNTTTHISKLPVWLSLALLVFFVVSANIYSLSSLYGLVPMDWMILFSLLSLITLAHLVLFTVFRFRRTSFSHTTQVAMQVWNGILACFWLFAPFLYLFTVNIDIRQLHFVAFAFLWEVPILGGCVILFSLVKFRSLESFVARGDFKDQSLTKGNEIYQKALQYPLWVGAMTFCVAFIGYVIGAWSIWFFADLSTFEAVKNVLNGTIPALFLGIYFYLVLDKATIPVRFSIEQVIGRQSVMRRKIHQRMFIVTIFTLLASIIFINFLVLQSFQQSIRLDIISNLERTMEYVQADIQNNLSSPNTLDMLRMGNRGRVDVITAGQKPSFEHFSFATKEYIATHEAGFIDDFKNDLKIVAFFENPMRNGEKIVVTVYVTDFYSIIYTVTPPFLLIELLIIILSVVFIGYVTGNISNSISMLSNAVRKAEYGNGTFELHLGSADETEELSNSFAHFIKEAAASRNDLKKGILERTKELELAKKSLERQNKELIDNREAMLNVLEDEKELGEKLRNGNNRLSTIISSIREGVVVLDMNFNVLLVNPAAQGLLDVFSSEILGKDYRELVSLYKDDKKMSQSERPIHKAFTLGQVTTIRPDDGVELETASGKRYPVAMSVSPFGSSGIVGLVIVFSDVSEDRAIAKSRNDFISISSHQFRAPLTSIRWFLEMLIDGDAGRLSSSQENLARQARDGTERLTEFLNKLLQVARMEARNISVEPVMVDLKAMTQSIIDSVRKTFSEKGQTVSILTRPNVLPTVPLDRSIVSQVVQNLLVNASMYSPENSEIKVTIDKKIDFFEYAVADRGMGIPEDQQSKIFSKFFRATNASKIAPKGSGLGLWLVKSLVESWGGKIWFKSDEGKGTTFYFTIPFSGMKAVRGQTHLTA